MYESVLRKEALSLWLDTKNIHSFPAVSKDEECDVLVVGGGITGVTTANLLSKENVNVILVEADRFLNLTTGNTTAKVTFQHDLIYRHILDKYDLNTAKLYYQAQREGMSFIEKMVKEHTIECGLTKAYAMIYAHDDEGVRKLKREHEAYEKIGIEGRMVDLVPFGLPGVSGLRVEDQMEFDPVRYLTHLLSDLKETGVKMFEHSRAVDLEEENGMKMVKMENGNVIRANRVVVATGFPFYDGSGQYFTRLAPYRSYLVAFPVEKTEDAMLITAGEPTYSIRYAEKDHRKYLLIGGRGHKVGQEDSAHDSYKELMRFGRNYFSVNEPSHRWSAQDYESLDKMPYIGKISSKVQGVYVATGFRKWGMTNGTFAAILLTDTLMGRESPYKDIFLPSRGEIRENLGKAVKENLNVAKEMIMGKVASKKTELSEIGLEEGGIVRHRGKRVGAYKDSSGKLIMVDATCTHLGCELMYNNAEHTYDCPCHGSRFRHDGTVIEGPAVKPLKSIEE
ncbi:FAD-dependent oxidoreductase [Proteiniclasticum sp.]|uniref:FAD-dependent oxidoreductase n=1 Tax=Proteiniclasticum sp. TaxID=2053595 RepID=UPI0028998B14|nr:FAD-dependent oxidoreductase [Proteiniclasticum sp.]